jgi:transcriptional regulator with GAF, ATPase, and Fis domain
MHERVTHLAAGQGLPCVGWSAPAARRMVRLDDCRRPHDRFGGGGEERLANGMIIGCSKAMQRVLAQARQVASTDSTVLLAGETGTGKEVVATYIHE